MPDTDAFASLNTREPLETPVTRAGLIMGTPGYMAPEQYRHEPLTGHADQFSFCATLHYALYGEHAFEGSGAAALARATLEGRLRPVPRDSDVPGWVRQVILRGLSPRPVDRYTSMEELLEVLQGEPRARRWRRCSPPWPWSSSARWWPEPWASGTRSRASARTSPAG
ncbi:hypothetical protein ACN28S_57415 [Cystobacter fuscus]